MLLPETALDALRAHLQNVQEMYERDLKSGYGAVYLPNALSRKYQNAAKEWGWQWVFPSPEISEDPREPKTFRCHRVHESGWRSNRAQQPLPQIGIAVQKVIPCGTDILRMRQRIGNLEREIRHFMDVRQNHPKFRDTGHVRRFHGRRPRHRHPKLIAGGIQQRCVCGLDQFSSHVSKSKKDVLSSHMRPQQIKKYIQFCITAEIAQ
jgi:hypothetical protein